MPELSLILSVVPDNKEKKNDRGVWVHSIWIAKTVQKEKWNL